MESEHIRVCAKLSQVSEEFRLARSQGQGQLSMPHPAARCACLPAVASGLGTAPHRVQAQRHASDPPSTKGDFEWISFSSLENIYAFEGAGGRSLERHLGLPRGWQGARPVNTGCLAGCASESGWAGGRGGQRSPEHRMQAPQAAT